MKGAGVLWRVPVPVFPLQLPCAPRYLLPCSHVMLSQKRAVRDLDIYGKTAAKFLSLIPRCCRPESPPPPHDRDEEPPSRARGMPLRPLRAPPHQALSLHPCSPSDSLPTLGTELSRAIPVAP